MGGAEDKENWKACHLEVVAAAQAIAKVWGPFHAEGYFTRFSQMAIARSNSYDSHLTLDANVTAKLKIW